MKDTNYFMVQSWMVTKLGLKGAERDVFAIIYGFTQDNESECKCGYRYMTEITGYSKPTIVDAIDRLMEQNLILKIKSEDANDMRNHYKCNHELVAILLADEGGKATLPPLVKPLNPPSKATLPHNISINKDITKEVQAEPVPLNKNHKHSQIYKERAGLTNVLESEKDIADYNNSRKLKPKEKFKKDCLDIIANLHYDDETKQLLVEYFNFVSTSKNVRRVKDIDLWIRKLDELAQLVEEGYNSTDIVRQSLAQKKFVFFPVANSQTKQSKNYEPGNVVPTQMSHDEILDEIARREEEAKQEGRRTFY